AAAARARAAALFDATGTPEHARTALHGPPPGRVRPRPAVPHRELPMDAESRLDLYLAEHFIEPGDEG
ncbi:MAG: hypothetical protein HOV92_21605, partial [Streptomyces sp.]|nr:hypothetical protein [Streptomyces sp.]